MSRSSLALAALATVAVPGLKPTAATGAESSNDFDLARIVDEGGRAWMVKAPRSVIAGAAMEGEVALLENLALAIDDGDLPFEVPRPAGFAPLPEGGRAMVFPQIAGRPLSVAQLVGMATSVAEAIAALHSLPIGVLAETGLPTYSAQEYRERRLSEVDEAAATGHVPGSLLQRWEDACEDVRLWRFIPTLVHGDLLPEHILTAGTGVVGVIEWAAAQVGDPADDLAPLLAAAPEEAMDTLLEAYGAARGVEDEHLLARAVLASELAILRWLMHGVRSDDADVITDAVHMLEELAAATEDADPIASIGVAPEEPAPALGVETSTPPADAEDSARSFAAPGSGAIPLGEPDPEEEPRVWLRSSEHGVDDDKPTVELPLEDDD